MGTRGVAPVFAAVLTLVALAGCTTPTPEPIPPVQLAFGEFQDATETASGHVAINRMADDSITAVLTDVIMSGDDLLLASADRWIDVEETCIETAIPVAGPGFGPSKQDIYILDPIHDSPEELAAFVVVRETNAPNGCLVEVVAFANLYWGSDG